MYIQLKHTDAATGRSLVLFHNINAAGHYIINNEVPCVQKVTVPTAIAHRMLALNGNARPAVPFGALAEQVRDFAQLAALLSQDFGYRSWLADDKQPLGVYGDGIGFSVYQRPDKERRDAFADYITSLRDDQFPALRDLVSTKVRVVEEEFENWTVWLPWKIKREQAHLLWTELTELRMWGDIQ